MIRIVHTADNHIGMKFNSRYPGEVSQKLINERFDALKRIVEKANKADANFIVIAGDLFDSISVMQKDIKRVTDILSEFANDVIVIPGNHDFYEDQNGKLWNTFRAFGKNNLHVLDQFKPYEFTVSDQKVCFFPAGCRSKHSSTNLIGWIQNETKDNSSLNIGIAHGNVDALGIDWNDKYFNMTQAELTNCRVDCWLLGHIHVPYPHKTGEIKNNIFYSATHTPDGFDNLREGFVWCLDFEGNQLVKINQWKTGSIRFFDEHVLINDDSDIDKLESFFQKLDCANILLRLNVEGRLTDNEKKRLVAVIKKYDTQFLYFTLIDETVIKLQKDQINALYTDHSLPHQLLTALSATKDDMALQLAHQIIEEVKK
jgi:DNA repair protein SbcD/Mre11